MDDIRNERTMLLLLFWAGQLVAGWAGLRSWRRGAPAVTAVLPWSLVTTVSLLAVTALEAPYSPWDVVRLAPAAGLVRGLPLYSTRDGDGAILSTMYTPISALAYVPAALWSDPAGAAVAGRALACLYVMWPILLVCCRSDGVPLRIGAAVFALAVLAALTSPALRYSATRIHSDAPALGLAGLACWLAVRGGSRAFGLACVCAWLSVWAKQTMVVLPLVLPVWSLATAGIRAGIRAAGCVFVTGVVVSGPFLMVWGGDAMAFNAVLWPGHLPWKGTLPGNLAGVAAELVPQALPFLIVLLAGLGWKSGSKSWLLSVLVGLALVPMAILGRVKKGGDLNSFSPALYPWLLACAARVAQLASGTDGSSLAWRRWLAAGLAGFTLMGIPTFITEAKIYTRLRPGHAEHAYLKAHPGQVYFPWHPLAHLTAEGRLTHHAHSVWERRVAGYPVSKGHTLAGIPPGCQFVAFPLKRLGPVVGFSWSYELLEWLGWLEKDATPVRLAGLPDYECYELRR
jgi:hypothetical protein